MSDRRNLILEEMGLSPQWRLRADHVDNADNAAQNLQSVETASTRPIAEKSSPAAHASIESIPKAVPKAMPAAPPQDGDRRDRIMRMEWAEIKACVASCIECELHKRRNKTVFGVGDENADWLFVGEGPGADEDAQGEPFVGQAGKLLDNMLAAIQLKRGANVYIANVVKCRPPQNRNPEPAEALACEPFLHRQIDLIKPKLIIALGKVAATNLLAREASIASLRGKVHQYRGTPLIVTYHPAYLLRSLPEKARAWEDLCFAVDTMERLKTPAAASI